MNGTMMKTKLTIVALCVAISGCSTVATKRTEASITEHEAKIAALKEQAGIGTGTVNKAATEKINKPYYGSRSVPFKARSVLPEKFKVVHEFRYPLQSFTLQQSVDKIAAVTGVSIRLAQDVTVQGDTRTFQLNMSASAESLLDQLCRTHGLHWEMQGGVAIVQRFVTRSLTLKVQPGTSGSDFSVGKSGRSEASSGAGTGQISTGFTTSAKVDKLSKMTPMVSTVEAIGKVLSKDGKVIGSEATGTIMVFDTIDGVERAERIVERENEVLTRAATFHIEVISFRANDTDSAGIDWQVAFSNLNKVGATLTSPKTLTNALGGTLGVQLLQGAGSTGRFDGTKAFITMLNEYGKTATVYKNDIRTRNRVTTTVQSLAQNVYIARTTPAPAGLNGAIGGTPGIEPGTVTAGVDLKMQPVIFDSNQISLFFNLGIVDLTQIVPLSTGTGANQVTIEGPETKGFEFQEETPLVPGVTTLISGYERTLESYTRRKLGRDVPILAGGSIKGEQTREQIFILITPTVVGSMY
jgi:type IVB pilus formation R64 PilN family outer membrane protein